MEVWRRVVSYIVSEISSRYDSGVYDLKLGKGWSEGKEFDGIYLFSLPNNIRCTSGVGLGR